MRQLIAVLVVALVALTTASADEIGIRIGDVPRTGSHFANARSAALCGASAATGGLTSVHHNPAAIGRIQGAEGFASLRINMTSRDYLPDGDASLEATDDGLLLAEAAAVKTTDIWTFGFAYATPAYRSLELVGDVETGERPLEAYDGEITASFRTFEAVLATKIGKRGQGIVGFSAGIATINETGRVVIGPDLEESWEIDGISPCYSIGFLFAPVDRVAVGIGYRFSSEIDVEGTGRGLEGEKGTFSTAPIATGGVTFVPMDGLALHASVIRESWHQAEAELDDPGAVEVLRSPNLGDPILTVAFGAEYDVTESIALRAGYSIQTADGFESTAVPENAFGVGATYSFSEYFVDASYVYESFEVDGESGDMTTGALHVAFGYEF